MRIDKRSISRDAYRIVDTIQASGYEAYLVGGAVRDLLLDRQPKDYDISTDASPEDLRRVFGRRARIIGRRFRLVHVYSGGSVYEVSTFRRRPDLEERRGRDTDSGLMVWRDNCYGTVEQDARRRDFTVNALYFDPVPGDGRLVDFVGGLDDIKARRVQMIGDAAERLAEDPVRTIRACKLVGQYGFSLSSDLRNDIRSAAAALDKCANARLVEELFKILKKPHTCATFGAASDLGVLVHFFPELFASWSTQAGHVCRRILASRDAMLAEGSIYPSRVTGLAMLMIAALKEQLEPDWSQPLWVNDAGIDRFIYEWSRNFMRPYRLPKQVMAKIRDVLLMQPKMLRGRSRKRIRRHPEFKRSEDTFRVISDAWLHRCVPCTGTTVATESE